MKQDPRSRSLVPVAETVESARLAGDGRSTGSRIGCYLGDVHGKRSWQTPE